MVNKWERGGVERYIETLVSHGDDPSIEFAIASMSTPVATGAECATFGPVISKSCLGKELVSGREIRKFLASGGYDVVHIHTNNGTGYLYARYAKESGVPRRIVHSHNTSLGADHRFAKTITGAILRSLYAKDVTDRWACSTDAGRFLFGDDPFSIMENGVDVQRFRYSVNSRRRTRQLLGLTDEPVLGFAANLIPVKNVRFAFDVYRSYRKRYPNAKLLVLGEGPQRKDLEDEIGMSHLQDDCILAGHVGNPEAYYCAMDVLLAPSIYEGLPINLIEAQTSGLRVLMSDTITQEAILNRSLCTILPLESGPDAWSRSAAGLMQDSGEAHRFDAYRSTIEEGYSLESSAGKVMREYRAKPGKES